MKLTKEEAIRQHRKMWLWIATETEKQKKKVKKQDYFESIGTEDIPLNGCYCCEYADINCELCPILWNWIGFCFSPGSSYLSWDDTQSWQVAAKAARAVAELPERKEVINYE